MDVQAFFVPHERAGRLKPPYPVAPSPLVPSVRHKIPTSRFKHEVSPSMKRAYTTIHLGMNGTLYR